MLKQTTITEAREMNIKGRLFSTREDIDEGMKVERMSKEEHDKWVIMCVIKGILKKKKEKEGVTNEKPI